VDSTGFQRVVLRHAFITISSSALRQMLSLHRFPSASRHALLQTIVQPRRAASAILQRTYLAIGRCLSRSTEHVGVRRCPWRVTVLGLHTHSSRAWYIYISVGRTTDESNKKAVHLSRACRERRVCIIHKNDNIVHSVKHVNDDQ